MNALRVISAAAAVLVLLAAPLSPGRAEDWTTTDGKIYKDVKVVKLEPDAVTILYRDGGALVPLATLPPALQEKFRYDPDKARAAANARAKADRDNPAALEAERIEAAKLKAAQDAKYKAQKKAVEDEKAAAAAAEPKDDPLHVSDFDVGKSDDSRPHYRAPDAFATNDPNMPVVPAP
ncbi:MAG TPA: hypothetical protein VHY09_15225 [Candidatus Methylacidiphilales bacterium]|jgi:hypothetical protein|nr:hypothetical protein [Candidatus Methylacidiphilales bacterium]